MSRPALLSSEITNSLLDELRKKLSGEFGVTLSYDPNGTWGRAGKSRFTLRWISNLPKIKGDFITVTLDFDRLSSAAADAEAIRAERGDK